MEWDSATRERLEVALNESDVVGARLDRSGRHADVLLHVLSLPPSGPLARDRRRILRLTEAGTLRFLLRRDRSGEQLATEPAIPSADLAAVEQFFESEIPIQAFIGDDVRQWEAFFAHDERLSTEAQDAAGREALLWRAFR